MATNEEFAKWLTDHTKAFGDKMAEYIAEARSAWHRVLCEYEPSDLKEATTRILAGDLQVHSYADHVRAVRRWCMDARSARRRIAESELQSAGKFGYRDGYRCLKCKDIGYIEVWSHVTIDAVLNGKNPLPLYTSMVPCYCEIGERHAAKFGRAYDMLEDCAVSLSTPLSSQIAELVEFLDRRRQRRATKPVKQAVFDGPGGPE